MTGERVEVEPGDERSLEPRGLETASGRGGEDLDLHLLTVTGDEGGETASGGAAEEARSERRRGAAAAVTASGGRGVRVRVAAGGAARALYMPRPAGLPPAPRPLGGAVCHNRAGLLTPCRAGPTGVLGWRPKPGTRYRGVLARARVSTGRAGLGSDQKIGLLGGIAGCGPNGNL